jgi:hypothetical protein
VRDDLPEHLRHGVFAHPRSFPAYVRFAGPGPDVPEADRDAVSNAMKEIEDDVHSVILNSNFAQEAADGAASLAWLRGQIWCNGRVGSYGFSYQGLTQLLSDDPEQLPDALAPAMAGLDERLHWASQGGCHWWALGLAWGLQLAAQGCRQRGDGQGWPEIRRWLSWGAGPRACQSLLLAGKARALLDGRPNVSFDDIRAIAKPVLRHRLVTSFTAESEGIRPDAIIDRIIEALPETG